jgi:DNA binding domain, excisionase family
VDTFSISSEEERALYLTTQQAADLLGGVVKPRTIVMWIKSGRITATRVPTKRGRYLIERDAFLANLQKLRVEAGVDGDRSSHAA